MKKQYITKNFTVQEMACPCCNACSMVKTFMDALQKLRDGIDCPIHINSGFRCEKHNLSVNGSKGSSHLIGRAADISCYGSPHRMKIISNAIGIFNRIGIRRDFIHIDLDTQKDQELIWIY